MTSACATTTAAQRTTRLHAPPRPARLWGLTARQLHDAYWRSRGIAVVRRGDATPCDRGARLFLLADADQLVLMDLTRRVLRRVSGKMSAARVALQPRGSGAYGERVLADEAGRLLAVQRNYDATSRDDDSWIVLTRDSSMANRWRVAEDARSAWFALRAALPVCAECRLDARGELFDDARPDSRSRFIHDLVKRWTNVHETLGEVRAVAPGVLAHASCRIARSAKLIGPAWIGAGVEIDGDACLAGPAFIPDAVHVHGSHAATNLPWRKPRPDDDRLGDARMPITGPFGKRAFDVLFAWAALSLVLMLLPIVAIAIWLEDGRPIFFGHRRQTLGGREFTCWKFRTMCRDAELKRAQLVSRNLADGPQFHVDDDPRLLRVGRWLRRFHIDELPQFWNVLKGEMSVVGPRPSPESENQFCPAWRETRLSVRPGITGLWQVSRTRAADRDFQEWIHFDMTYVRRPSWRMDLWIMWRTLAKIVFR